MDGRYLAGALAFGLPMIPHALAHWGLSLSDRAILGAFLQSADVGVYYVAYQFGLPISVIAIALTQAVQPLYAEASITEHRDAELARAASHQALVAAFLTMAVAVLGPPAVHAFLPSEYAPAASFVPWIALGHGLFALYFIPMNAITVLSGRNRWVWVVTVTAALVNVGLNLLLVPRIGATAAAINTAVGYAILLFGVSMYMYRVVERPVTFEWARIGLGLMLIVAASASAMLFNPSDPVLGLVIRGGVVALVIVLFATVGLMKIPSIFARLLESRR
jgi:O-antigen/teichoic acid export membrane protein